jgi:hypothetical protein
MRTIGIPQMEGLPMTATTIALDPDVIRLRALLERLDPREHEPCSVEGCCHIHSHEMQELEAA